MDQRRSVSLWRTDEGWTRLKSRRRESWNGNSSDSDPLRLQLRHRSAGQRNRSRPRVAGGDLVRFFPPYDFPSIPRQATEVFQNLCTPKSFETKLRSGGTNCLRASEGTSGHVSRCPNEDEEEESKVFLGSLLCSARS